MDIAIYFAEIFIKNYDNLTWGLITKPKSLVYVNRPVVVGFSSGVELDPRLLVYNLILNKMDGSAKKEDLYNLFEVWERRYLVLIMFRVHFWFSLITFSRSKLYVTIVCSIDDLTPPLVWLLSLIRD